MSNTMLKVAALPHDIIFADPDSNLVAVGEALEKIPAGTDVVVLPELFTTGYVKDNQILEQVSEDNDGQTITALRRWASQYNTAIAGSFLAGEGRYSFFNRGFFVEPCGEVTYYDKKHLFSPSGESEIYTAGRSRFHIVRFRGWNIMLFICYDLRFPLWCRNMNLEYDLALFPANWADARAYAFRHLLIARAIENQACVVGANRLGKDPFGNYPASMTEIFNWWGDPVGERDSEPFVTATLNRLSMDQFRHRFPVYLDADNFEVIR